jgi:hypothetical protein
MVRPERFELPTYSSGGCRSIQLSYGRTLYESTTYNSTPTLGELSHRFVARFQQGWLTKKSEQLARTLESKVH